MGPATATALLTALDPSIPWLGDEAQQAALGDKKYTVGQVVALTQALRDKARALAAAEAEEGGGGEARSWTASDLECCLFAEAALGSAPTPAKAAAGAAAGAEGPGGEGGGGSSASRKKQRR